MASPTTTPTDLPSHVICSEILTRTTPETLGRCRLVSKDWNHATYESNFLDLLCERTNTTYGFFIQTLVDSKWSSIFVPIDKKNNNGKSISLSFLPSPFKIEAAHRGLLVCVSDKNHKIPRYLVCKPTTRQWVEIPNPKTRFPTERLALVMMRSNSSLRYKIVRFSRLKDFTGSTIFNKRLRCEVFDSDTWAWKQLKDMCLSDDDVFFTSKHAVSASGALHWLLSDDKVFAFHQENESWETFDLPNIGHNIEKQLVEYQGRLALICKKDDGENTLMKLRVIEDYDRKIWSQNEKILSIKDEEYSFGALCNSNVALVFDHYNKVGFYNFEDSSLKIAAQKQSWYYDGIFMLESDREETNLRRPILQKKSSDHGRRRITRCLDGIDTYIIWRPSPSFSFIFFLFLLTFFCYWVDI